MAYQNLNTIFLNNFSQFAAAPAQLFKQNNRYQQLNYQRLGTICLNIAKGLLKSGHEPGERMVIYAGNRPEWAQADIGGILAGLLVSAAPSSSSAEALAAIVNDLEAAVVCVGDPVQLLRVRKVLPKMPSVRRVVLFDETLEPQKMEMLLAELVDVGAGAGSHFEYQVREIAKSIKQDEPVCVIYTSGTTGLAKGVTLTHGNYLAAIQGLLQRIGRIDKLHRNFSILPLSHAFERLAGYYLLIYLGRCIAYPGSRESLLADMMEVKPSFVAAMPGFFEKLYSGIVEQIEAAAPLKKRIFNWALHAGRRYHVVRKTNRGNLITSRLRYWVADFAVFRRIRAAFGGELQFFVSGGARLNPYIAGFFQAMGILLLEGWGMTEATAVATINSPDDYRLGSVGRPLPGMTVRLGNGKELEIAGANVFPGYWNSPELTKQYFTEDGYYRTGDLGELDSQGWVTITGRKKELIITAGGKNITPVYVERILVKQRHIDMAFIHGDRRKYLTALLALNDEEVTRTAAKAGFAEMSIEERRTHSIIEGIVQQEVDNANLELANHMQIKYFRILRNPFSIQNGEMTRTLELKRKVIEEKYQHLLNSMYIES